ncbi:MAG TPA: hypothetical protein VGJ76_11505 [Pseudolabrys sp.]
MTTATLAAPDQGAAVRIDRLFLALALASASILMALVLLDHQPASAALIVGGFGLGVAFLKAEFSYTASWRRFLTRGEAGGLFGGLIVIAICACVVVPVAALSPKYGGAIAPLGPSLIIAAFVFFCRRDAACQWVRFRNAVYRRRRIGTHAGGTVILCHRQRTWQSLVAGLPCPRRNRSGAGVGLFWCLGQIGAHAWQHRHCRGVRRRRSPQARR